MYCPRCGKEESSDRIKFCTICGFDLTIVAETLGNEGLLPQLNEMRKFENKTINRMRILFSLSVWLVLSFLFNLISSIAGGGNSNEIIIASAGLALGILIMFLSAPYLLQTGNKTAEEDFSAAGSAPANQLKSNGKTSLPPVSPAFQADYDSPSVFRKTPTTGKLVPVSSVVEDSTKLLIRNK